MSKYYIRKPQNKNDLLKLKKERFIKTLNYDNEIKDSILVLRFGVTIKLIKQWRAEYVSNT